MRALGRLAITRELALLAIIAIVSAVYAYRYPKQFPTPENITTMLRNVVLEGMIAVGMTVMLVGGLFDLSVGAMASLAGVVVGYCMKSLGWPIPAAIAGGVAIAALGGLVNGLIVAKVRVNALITTLGTMAIFKGAAERIGGPGISNLPEGFSQFGRAEPLGLQTPVWILIALAVVIHYLLAHTRWFRQYYYIGSNARAAELSGIAVERLQVLAFTVMGLIAGSAGIVYAARYGAANSTVGSGAELQAITAVILGGASLSGGKGTVWGTLVGVLFIALVKNVLFHENVESEWRDIVVGVVLVMAVALDSWLNRWKR
jgi:ribose/xylose/arabinose/galactoside ABC-type transport system permease subunit